jgi:hypothetical protein
MSLVRAFAGNRMMLCNTVVLVQHNSFGLPGWHVDCGSELGKAYLNDPGYKFGKCGLFLQDDTNGWGGSIYVIPFSHKAFRTRNKYLRKFLRAVGFLQAKWNIGRLTAPVKAGDLLFFDSRLLHQSAEPSPDNRKDFEKIGPNFWRVPEEHTKYVMYWDACHPAMVHDFLQNVITRAYEEGPNPDRVVGREVAFSRNMALCFPDDYPDEVVKLAKELGVEVASLDRDSCQTFKERVRVLTSPSL